MLCVLFDLIIRAMRLWFCDIRCLYLCTWLGDSSGMGMVITLEEKSRYIKVILLTLKLSSCLHHILKINFNIKIQI